MFLMLVVSCDKPNCTCLSYAALLSSILLGCQSVARIGFLYPTDINEMRDLLGPVMTKFTIALREIGTYKEVLRSQVIYFILFFLLKILY